MANPRATGKKSKRGPELVQRVRAAILNAMDAVEKDGMLISEILAEQFQENPIRFLELASKFTPRERNVEHSGTVHQTHEHRTVSEIDARIEEMLKDREDRHPTKTLPN